MERLAMPVAVIVILLTGFVAAFWNIFSLRMLATIFTDQLDLWDFEAILGVCFLGYGIWATQNVLYDMASGFSMALLRRRIVV